MLNFHIENKFDITIGGMIHEYQIPFGVLSIKNQKLKQINEKPTISNLVNAGIYVLSNKVLDIKRNKNINGRSDTENKKMGKEIGVFPMHENWIDVGSKINLDKAKTYMKKK